MSLESLSLKPVLYEVSTESPASTVTNGTGLFTWQDIDTILNTTSKMESPVQTSTSSEALSSAGSGSTQNLPFLEDFFNINLSPVTTVSSTTQTTTASTSTSPESTSVSSTKKTTLTSTTANTSQTPHQHLTNT